MTDHPSKTDAGTPDEIEVFSLVDQIRGLLHTARSTAARSLNTLQVLTNFEIGRRIVEFEQQGAKRADYGKLVVKTVSERLTAEFGRGFSKSNLEYMRRFYLEYRDRTAPIAQTASGQFKLSWSQYIFLLAIQNPNERAFYEHEADANGWTLPELRRQFDTSLYERLALSRDPQHVKTLAQKGQQVAAPQDLIKDPYVLEFLGLDEKSHYSEHDLETAIIDKLEHFLLELGKGFLFEARQKRFTFDEDHFYVDLVFYNRLLRCYVLIDLKIGKLTHQDLGQMQMYVNYFDRFVKQDDEQPTIGIVLCKMKSDALVEITLPADSNIQAARYQLYLPDKEDLRQQLLDWSEDGITRQGGGEDD